jgi:TrmH family RNA methyltransferase
MPSITSLQNERVKSAVRLRERRERDRTGLMLVEGRYELELALAGGVRVQAAFLCEELAGGATLTLPGTEPTLVSRPVFEKMSYRDNPDGWLAVVTSPSRTLDSLRLSAAPLLILAEAVEKPGNLGAMLRTADAAGVEALLVCTARTDLYNPNVVRASRGTLFTVPAVQTGNEQALAWLRGKGIRVLAAAPGAESLHTDADMVSAVCIALGTEDAGLSDFWMNNADLQVRIPMAGRVNSLNVSTSAAILAYEAVRQRQAGPLDGSGRG